jgi:hypothetical protein
MKKPLVNTFGSVAIVGFLLTVLAAGGLAGSGTAAAGQQTDLVARHLKTFDVRIHLAELSSISETASWEDVPKNGVIPDDLAPLLSSNTDFSYYHSEFDGNAMGRSKIVVKEYNRQEKE